MSSNFRSNAIRLVAEMLVVFVGVYAAFELESARSDRADAKRANQILVAMEQDLAESQATLDAAVPALSVMIDSFLTEHEAGRMPEIGHLALSMSFRSRTWEAMLQSGGVNLLDVDFLLEMEDYWGAVQMLYNRTNEGRQMSVALIVPRLNEGNETFYDLETKQLKPSYRWYLTMLAEFRDQISSIHKMNGEILGSIRVMLDDNGG